MARPKAYQDTTVPVHKSREDIERQLKRAKATAFQWTTAWGQESFQFALETEQHGTLAFRLAIPIPEKSERGRRQAYRALYWYLKAKMEAIEFGLVDVAQEFLPHMLAGGGRTMWEVAEGQIDQLAQGTEIRVLPEGKG